MTETLQLDQIKIVQLDDAPRLLVQWSPRWHDFVTSIGPALARSGPRLAGEAPLGVVAYRGFTAGLLLQLLLLFAVIALPRQIDRLRPYAAPKLHPYEVIYYSGDELPRTEDLSGSEAGKTATAGGQEAHHRTQTIRIARGNSLSKKVVDAPDLKLPSSAETVANLLAFKSALPSPSAENLHSSFKLPALAANVIQPAPADVNTEHSRSGLTLNSVIPPAPRLSAEQARSALSLNSAVVPPAPTAPSDHTLIAPRLDASIIGPAPKISRQHRLSAPELGMNVIAPAPQISASGARSTPALSARVIAPAPVTNGIEVPPTRVRMTKIAVVPPPVSAPEREQLRNAKLNLPAPSIVAPPPSADSAHDLLRLESGVAASSPSVVPPPPTQAAAPSFMSSIIGKIFGTQDVVPPPPSVSSGGRSVTSALTAEVVPPPPNVTSSSRNSPRTIAPEIVPPAPSASGASGISRFSPRTSAAAIVPPPPSVSAAGGTAAAARTPSNRNLPTPEIVPPPPSVQADAAASGTKLNPIANRLANNIVPPPPSVTSASGSTGKAFGAAPDFGSAYAPPKGASGTNDSSGIVASAQPGSNVAVSNAARNSLAISPSGGDKAGLGGSGAGSGIGNSKGSGSGLTAEKPSGNSGGGKTGVAHGFDQTARGGISTTPGPGGAGSLAAGSPAVPGVDVRGGSTVITLPSFGSDASDPNLPRRSNAKADPQGLAITIVATSRSGGAFNFYGELPGNNYSVYIDTSIGTVVMQFAEANPAPNSQLDTLTGPEAIRADLPANLPHARMVVKCRLTATGNITDLQVLEPGPAAMTAKIVAALPGWKFRPAMRGSQPVEINAILGFNINTNDRN